MIVELYEIPVQAALTAVKSRRDRGDRWIAVYDAVSVVVLLLPVGLEYHLPIGPWPGMPRDARLASDSPEGGRCPCGAAQGKITSFLSERK